MYTTKRFFASALVSSMFFVLIAPVHAQKVPNSPANKLCTPAFLKLLSKKDKKSQEQTRKQLMKLLPTIPLSQFISTFGQETKKKGKAPQQACRDAATAKQSNNISADLKKAEDLVNQIDPKKVKAEMTTRYHKDDSDPTHIYGFRIVGDPVWVRLTLLQLIFIKLTTKCPYGSFIFGEKEVDSVILDQGKVPDGARLKYERDNNKPGCPDTEISAEVILKKDGRALKVFKPFETIWTPESWGGQQ